MTTFAPKSLPTPPGGKSQEFYSPARQSRAAAPIVPAGSVTGKSLTVVITIMCHLSCLMAGSVYLLNRQASNWFNEIASEVTVQVKPIVGADNDRRADKVARFLKTQPGVAGVNPLSEKDSAALVEPWFGSGEVLNTLPIPRLIAIVIDKSNPPNLDQLRQTIKRSFDGVVLDDHRHFRSEILEVTRTLALGGIVMLLLMAAATTAIIISATRSALASNKEIVEVLHFVGATDSFIAREFEKHFLALGIRAGLIGAISAGLVFALIPLSIKSLEGQTFTLREASDILGTATLDLPGYIILIIVVIVIAAICMLTSRYGVYRILNTQN
ncbi:MAG: cell division protein FtsX [Methyloligellaceae bacterium]